MSKGKKQDLTPLIGDVSVRRRKEIFLGFDREEEGRREYKVWK